MLEINLQDYLPNWLKTSEEFINKIPDQVNWEAIVGISICKTFYCDGWKRISNESMMETFYRVNQKSFLINLFRNLRQINRWNFDEFICKTLGQVDWETKLPTMSRKNRLWPAWQACLTTSSFNSIQWVFRFAVGGAGTFIVRAQKRERSTSNCATRWF